MPRAGLSDRAARQISQPAEAATRAEARRRGVTKDSLGRGRSAGPMVFSCVVIVLQYCMQTLG